MDIPQPFSVGRSAVLKQLIVLPSTGWPIWLVLLAGLSLTAVGCFYDVRFMVLGLMICVSVVPAVGAFVYFSQTLSPSMVANLLPHTLERQADGYVLRIWRRPDTEVEGESEQEWMESGCVRLYDEDIVSTKTSLEYEILFFKDSLMKILYVPRF